MIDKPDLILLECKLSAGGWDLETQRNLLDYLKGAPVRFACDASVEIYEEALKQQNVCIH